MWQLRRCDRAIIVLESLLGEFAQDTFQPLSKKRDETLKRMRDYMKRYRGKFENHEDALDEGVYLPVLPSLGRPATSEDVEKGLARFSLDSPGGFPSLEWPAYSEWFAKEGRGWYIDDPDRPVFRDVVILQTEQSSDGGLWFGIADGTGFHVVPSKEIGALSFPALRDPNDRLQ